MIDSVLESCGDFGRTQWLLLLLFCVVNVFSAFHYFAQTFISTNPTTNCSTSADQVIIFELGNTSHVLYQKVNSSDDRMEYHDEWNVPTLVSELHWVCDEQWKSAFVQSTYFLGSVLGTLLLGILSDKVGRRPMLITATLLAVIGNMLTVCIPPCLWTLSIGRFVAGLATDTNFFMMYIIVMEYIRPSLRTIGLNLCIGVWYCAGCMLIPWIAVACMDWRHFLISISVPMLLIPVISPCIPESAQWLLSRGRVDDALSCFQKVAVINGKTLSDEKIKEFKKSLSGLTTYNNKSAGIPGLFATPRLRMKTCILLFKTMVLTLCYDAMSRNIEVLGFDPYIMFTVTSATTLPSCIVILLLQDVLGRKLVAVSALLLTALLNFGQGTIIGMTIHRSYLAAALSLFGRFAVNIAYNSGTQYAAELIPTQVRGQGLACIHVVGYAATFFSPHILYLASKWKPLPEIILGVLSFLGAAVCLLLPETLNRSLPVTLEDGEKFGEEEHFWEFLTQMRPKKDLIINDKGLKHLNRLCPRISRRKKSENCIEIKYLSKPQL